MAKKTKDGLIVKGFKNLAGRFSPEAEKYARYKIQKQKGTYKGPATEKLPTKAKYRGSTPEEKKSMSESLSVKQQTPQKAAIQKKKEKANISNQLKAAKAEKLAVNKPSASKKINTNKKPGSKYFNDPNISEKEKRIAKRSLKRKKRQDDRAERIALRKDITFDEAKALQGERKLKRKQFLKDFASNLAGVEQRTVRGTMQTQDMSDSFGKQPQSSAEKAQQVEQAQEEENIKNKFFTSSANEGLGDIGFLFNPYDSFKKS